MNGWPCAIGFDVLPRFRDTYHRVEEQILADSWGRYGRLV